MEIMHGIEFVNLCLTKLKLGALIDGGIFQKLKKHNLKFKVFQKILSINQQKINLLSLVQNNLLLIHFVKMQIIIYYNYQKVQLNGLRKKMRFLKTASKNLELNNGLSLRDIYLAELEDSVVSDGIMWLILQYYELHGLLKKINLLQKCIRESVQDGPK